MNQNFIIKQHSNLPTLRMELINDGRNDFKKFFEMVQNCSITFSMKNMDTDVYKISNANAYIVPKSKDSAIEQYLICYDWKSRDTKEKGTFEGTFTLTFDGTLSSEYDEYTKGALIKPIREKLIITKL